MFWVDQTKEAWAEYLCKCGKFVCRIVSLWTTMRNGRPTAGFRNLPHADTNHSTLTPPTTLIPSLKNTIPVALGVSHSPCPCTQNPPARLDNSLGCHSPTARSSAWAHPTLAVDHSRSRSHWHPSPRGFCLAPVIMLRFLHEHARKKGLLLCVEKNQHMNDKDSSMDGSSAQPGSAHQWGGRNRASGRWLVTMG